MKLRVHLWLRDLLNEWLLIVTIMSSPLFIAEFVTMNHEWLLIVTIMSSPLFVAEFVTTNPLSPSLLASSEQSRRAPLRFMLLLELYINLMVKAILIVVFVDWPESIMKSNPG
jgi:hypothetical protein